MVLRSDEQSEKRRDWPRWVVVVTLLLAGIVANHYYSGISMPLRLLVWFAVLVVAGIIGSTTKTGQWVVQFFKDSRLEMRKVVWPTRQETMQTTMVVAAMVVILAMILWGVDAVLVWLIGTLTGQRG